MEADLLGLESVADDPGAVMAASPVTYAACADVPVLLMHGSHDGTCERRPECRAQSSTTCVRQGVTAHAARRGKP